MDVTTAVPPWSKHRQLKTLRGGSFGQVYLVARVDESDEDVLVAKRTSMVGLSQQLVDSNVNEVYVLTLLSHPNVVKFIEHYLDTDGFLNIITEYCSGGDLQDFIQLRIADENPFEEREKVNLIFQMLVGLKYLHDSEIIHRDLKPGNIFLQEGGIVKIGDFGISRMVSTTTMAQTMVGTPFYLSPEICNNNKYTYPVDIWSLGCIFYELETLHRPFEGSNILAIAQAVSTCSYKKLSLSSRIAIMIDKMLVINPDCRMTASELLVKFFSFTSPLEAETMRLLSESIEGEIVPTDV